jgi:prolipoprotein diacylglyceryl transferase
MLSLYINWNVDPEIFNVLGISLRYYGLLFVGGLIVCAYVLGKVFKEEGIPQEHLEKLCIYGAIGVFVGARLGHCLFYDPVYYLTHIIEMLLPIELVNGSYKFVGYQGLASHGGAIGLIIAIIIYSRKTKESALKTIDIMGIVAPLQGFFIRTANLMNSEIYGVETDVPWAFIFMQKKEILPKHPTQIYEALCYISIFVLLIILYRKKIIKLQSGAMFGLSITLIFIARFFIEFVKELQEPWEIAMKLKIGLNMGQLLSIPFILIGTGFIIYGINRTKKGLIPAKSATVSQRREKRNKKR